MHALLTTYIPSRCQRSSSRPTGLLAEPRCRTVVGFRAFYASAPKEWNRLPEAAPGGLSPPNCGSAPQKVGNHCKSQGRGDKRESFGALALPPNLKSTTLSS